ncbi:MAG TPA: cytochrome-c oxidase, cbb3-type subunit III, partial [Woeseiaceae bacterium]
MSEQKLQSQTVQTTGHAWDGDLQEYNNPLPVWWVYTFYATVVFALVYWTLYPSWPLGKGWIGGVSEITYVNSEGETKTHSWNTRALLMADMNKAALAQKPYFDKIEAMSYEQIARDPEMNGFILSAGKVLFADNCAGCHQAGGQGVIGFFPNLTDDDWLYGGSFEKVHETLMDGRRGYMPAFNEVLNGEQIDQLAHYVASRSGIEHDAGKAAAGDVLFRSETAACYYCHTSEATGRQDM